MKKPTVIHDLKNERPDLTPPLSGVMAFLPILFYASILGSLGLGTLSVLATKKAVKAEKSAVAMEQEEQTQLTLIKTEFTTINEEQNKAKEVEAWVKGTNPLMNIMTSIISSIRPGNTLTSLKLERTPENPEHLKLGLIINNGGSTQVDETTNALLKLGYQTFDDVTKGSGNSTLNADVTFSALLVNTGSAVPAPKAP